MKRVNELRNDTVINVAALLKEPVGATRDYDLDLDRFDLDRDLVAKRVRANARLTRLQDEILVDARAIADVELECDRCLNRYDQVVKARFSAQYEPTIDVHTGGSVGEIDDETERFSITEHHEVDLAEPLRQELIVALPMVAICGPDCPGPTLTSTRAEDEIDDRLAALSRLLDSD